MKQINEMKMKWTKNKNVMAAFLYGTLHQMEMHSFPFGIVDFAIYITRIQDELPFHQLKQRHKCNNNHKYKF